MMDSEFGQLERFGDKWVGESGWVFSCSGTTRVRFTIRSGDHGPTLQQRQLFHEIRSRYESLWPRVEHAILALCGVDSGGLVNALQPRLLLFVPALVGEEEFDFMLGYELNEHGADTMGYFVDSRGRCANSDNSRAALEALT